MKDPLVEEVELVFDDYDRLIQNKLIRGLCFLQSDIFASSVERDFDDLETDFKDDIWAPKSSIGIRPVRNR